jgi:hypothetical protein
MAQFVAFSSGDQDLKSCVNVDQILWIREGALGKHTLKFTNGEEFAVDAGTAKVLREKLTSLPR